MADVLVSAVIPTYNHRELVRRCLESLLHQTIASQIEIIVIDDGSADGTKEMLEGSEFPHIVYIRGDREGPPKARNKGIDRSRAALVAFIDDDIVCKEDCFAQAIKCFQNEKVGIVQTNLMIAGSRQPILRRSASQGFITAAIFFRKAALLKVGGLDEDFFDRETGMFFRDDTDLGFRIVEAGYKSVQSEEAIAWHPVLFKDLNACFAHVRRYMFDPLLYRKHPKAFRSGLERKVIGPLHFGRPMHYASLLHCCAVLALLIGLVGNSVLPLAVAGATYFVVRFKFQGKKAFHVWNVRDTASFIALPWTYVYWFVRGCRKFGGWRAII